MGIKELAEQGRQAVETALSNHRCIVDGLPHWHSKWTPGCAHCQHEY